MYTLKLRNNLFISGNKIISYETEVAQIKKGVIVELGKFSRTTSKQIQYVSRITGMPIRYSDTRKTNFWKFDMGVKIELSNTISTKASVEIAKGMSEGKDFAYSCASLERISKKDEPLINNHLRSIGVDDEVFQKLRKIAKLKILL
jgi:hypothetical protein